MIKIEIEVNEETGRIDVRFEPEDQIIIVGTLECAKDVVKDHCAKQRSMFAQTGITGFGTLDVNKGTGQGASVQTKKKN
jgi:hypothetical protein